MLIIKRIKNLEKGVEKDKVIQMLIIIAFILYLFTTLALSAGIH